MFALYLLAAAALAQADDALSQGLWYLPNDSDTAHHIAGGPSLVQDFAVGGKQILATDFETFVRYDSTEKPPVVLTGLPNPAWTPGYPPILQRTAHGFLVGTDRKGMWYVPDERREFKLIRTGDEDYSPTFSALQSTPDGALAGSWQWGLWAWKEGSRRLVPIQPLRGDNTHIVSLARTLGRAWIGSDGDGAWYLPDRSLEAVRIGRIPKNASCTTVRALGTSVFVGTKGAGLWRVDPSSASAQQILPAGPSRSVFDVAPSMGRFVIAASDGVWIWTPGQAHADRISSREFPYACKLSSDGTMLLEQASGFLFLIDARQETVVRCAGKDVPAEVTDIYPRKRDVLVGILQFGACTFDRATHRFGRVGGPYRSTGDFARYGDGVLFTVIQTGSH